MKRSTGDQGGPGRPAAPQSAGMPALGLRRWILPLRLARRAGVYQASDAALDVARNIRRQATPLSVRPACPILWNYFTRLELRRGSHQLRRRLSRASPPYYLERRAPRPAELPPRQRLDWPASDGQRRQNEQAPGRKGDEWDWRGLMMLSQRRLQGRSWGGRLGSCRRLPTSHAVLNVPGIPAGRTRRPAWVFIFARQEKHQIRVNGKSPYCGAQSNWRRQPVNASPKVTAAPTHSRRHLGAEALASPPQHRGCWRNPARSGRRIHAQSVRILGCASMPLSSAQHHSRMPRRRFAPR